MTHPFAVLSGAALAAATALVPIDASAQGVVLNVFGGSSLDVLAPRETPDVQADVLAQVKQGFLEAHPEVSDISWDAQGPQTGSLQRLMTARLSGQEMDIIACPAFWVNGSYVRRGLLRPLEESDTAGFIDNIEPSALGAFSNNGKLYGIPVTTMSTSTIYYNKAMFAEAGIPELPNYEDLVAGAEKLSEAGVIPLLHQGGNTVMWPMWLFETLSQSSGDAPGLTNRQLAGEEPFNSEAMVEAFALIRQWVDDGILSPDSLAVDMEGMRAAFAAGRSAMYYGGTWEIPSLQENVTDFDWGVFPFPQMPGVAGAPGHGGGADNGLCLSATIPDEKVKPALDFISYLTQPEVAHVYLDPEKPIATSIKGVDGVGDAYAVTLRETTFPDTIKFLDWVWPTEIASSVASSISGVVGGTITPQEAADALQETYNGLIAAGTWPPQD